MRAQTSLLLILLSLLLSACAGELPITGVIPQPQAVDSADPANVPSGIVPAPRRAQTPLAPAPTITIVQVNLSDTAISMPHQVRVGPAILGITNSGNSVRDFRIQGPAVDQKFDQPLEPGETRLLKVVLQPGAYEVFCMVNGQKDAKLRFQFTANSK